ncbi:glutamate--tRNA ligase [Pseudobacillus badius]|uniref:glutamate--tRNA ligase n=1 Tax=Bacillus badius TaxID=1455 RepID=UPI0005973D60|nr:glutamate--tRNA ligase [Bacillus badius]KIL72110.1 Glutamyl-tRNA synthetase [Bacillus badius]KZO00592.1 glutamate--tRNA ligase [Bacillus badius]MED0668097.1 glutamate--tRNA ligase [Bacillus badius]OCS87374.1 glutamate--tRNA ligase [Bacillus badius]OVE48824.1 glutamate--tRNA ligase [Bacillus badius]
MANEIRVRYAPSPTGHLHIGNARTALFNYLFARSKGGKFIIRIEDTDQKRNIAGGEESQLKYLKWLGIDWDESVDKEGEFGPYRQSERNDIYKKYYDQLVEEGKAYKCYCTEEELEAEREAQQAEGKDMAGYSGKCRHLTPEERAAKEAEGRKPSIRIKVPAGEMLTFNDMVKGEVSFESEGISDYVIVKKDGTPTYNFAVAIDDHLMKMTHVLRGDDHISNTPKQLLIYNALGWEPPTFGHMTLIVNESRKKLSKRDESIIQFIEQYKELGYLPEALFNFIALLGWSPAGEEEIFSKEEFIEMFDASRLSKSPALFDQQKLSWMNNQYMKKVDLDRVVELAAPHLVKAGWIAAERSPEEEEWVRELIGLYQEKMSFGAQIAEMAELFFKEDVSYEEEAKAVLAEEQVPEVMASFLEKVEAMDNWQADEIKQAMKAVQKETGHKGKKLFMPIRAAVTGQTHGPDLPKAIELLGKEKVAERLRKIHS